MIGAVGFGALGDCSGSFGVHQEPIAGEQQPKVIDGTENQYSLRFVFEWDANATGRTK